MTTKMLDAEWAANPTKPGRIAAGEAVQIDVTVDYAKVPHSETGPSRLEQAMRLVKETEALVVAAPAMARALLRHVEGCFICHGTGRSNEAVPPPELVRDATCRSCADDRAVLALAGVPLQ